MSEINLNLNSRTITGKKLASLRSSGLIPSVIYGGKEPILASSAYVETEKALKKAGYHSPIKLNIDKKPQLALVKSIATDSVSRKIINVEFQAISTKEAVEATAPITVINFETSDAAKLYHFAFNQAMTEIDVKAKPADLPSELTIDASGFKTVEDKLTLKDLKLPKGVELVNKNLDEEQVIASVYDPAAEAEAREAESTEEEISAADVPADNGQKPEETAEEKSE